MNDRSPADLLTAAADRLEELMLVVPAGPWEADNSEVYGPARDWVAETLNTDDDERTDASAMWIATMDPLVGAALVAWLRDEAGLMCTNPVRFFALGPDGLDMKSPGIAVARAILGEVTT